MTPNNTPESGDLIEVYLRRLSKRVSSLSHAERDQLEREVRAHLESLVTDGLAQGLTKEQALEAAIQRFGNPSKLARAMNTRGVTWLDYAVKVVAVAAWSAGLCLWAVFSVAGASGALLGTLLRWGKTTNEIMEIMPVADFLGKVLPFSGFVVAFVGLLLGSMGILPGTAQTSRHGKTLSLRAMGLWLLAPCATVAAILSALWASEICLGRNNVSFSGAVLCAFSLLLSAPYIQVWRKRRLQKN